MPDTVWLLLQLFLGQLFLPPSFPSVSHHVDSQGGLMSTSPQKQWVWSLRQPCSQVLDPGMRLEWGLVQSSADS